MSKINQAVKRGELVDYADLFANYSQTVLDLSRPRQLPIAAMVPH